MSESVSASTVIDGVAPAEVFAWLADPANHARSDGSEHVLEPIGPDRLTRKGQRFGMKMRWIVPYRVTNTVVEFEQDRRLAWRHFAGHRWRYELEPLDGATRVTETFDLTPVPGPLHLVYRVAFGYPDAYRDNLISSLHKLEAELTDA